MAENQDSLYADWKKLYPRYQKGFFRRLKWGLLFLFLGIYYLLPFVRWDRGVGVPNQAILFDLPARKFYLFDLVIWPQDIFVLAGLLISAALGLFLMTALAGRVFCGYICFQTIWTDLYLYVEYLVEGNRKKRVRLDAEPWSAGKLMKKLVKHTLWLVIALATGGAFVFYFADAPTLFHQFLTATAPFAAWFTLLFLTITTYTMAGIAREQVCTYMCPYARFQGAMFDDNTLIIAYHPEHGEPRESNRRNRKEMGEAVGECIDCNACVTVCPTGVDIRQGQQYECITCGLCIDACDEVAAAVGMEHRLISYTSLTEMTGRKTRWLRPRTLAYSALILLLLGGMAYYLATRPPVEMSVIRHRQPIYITLSDGSIQNNFTIRVLNMSPTPRTYALEVKGLEQSTLSLAAIDRFDKSGRPLISIQPGKVMPYTAYLKQNKESGGKGAKNITFHLVDSHETDISDIYDSVFIRP
ncbi:MAG: cytochrome c oxidase accessory protein CcoG [Magnetococcales bacterium]|nr:cytochrome c oxidase accessory protein CcoG [Magnetococcales bacterium]